MLFVECALRQDADEARRLYPAVEKYLENARELSAQRTAAAYALFVNARPHGLSAASERGAGTGRRLPGPRGSALRAQTTRLHQRGVGTRARLKAGGSKTGAAGCKACRSRRSSPHVFQQSLSQMSVAVRADLARLRSACGAEKGAAFAAYAHFRRVAVPSAVPAFQAFHCFTSMVFLTVCPIAARFIPSLCEETFCVFRKIDVLLIFLFSRRRGRITRLKRGRAKFNLKNRRKNALF